MKKLLGLIFLILVFLNFSGIAWSECHWDDDVKAYFCDGVQITQSCLAEEWIDSFEVIGDRAVWRHGRDTGIDLTYQYAYYCTHLDVGSDEITRITQFGDTIFWVNSFEIIGDQAVWRHGRDTGIDLTYQYAYYCTCLHKGSDYITTITQVCHGSYDWISDFAVVGISASWQYCTDDGCSSYQEILEICSIQEAIDAASNGDEIVIGPGIYYENIDFNGKAITLRSTNPDDPAVVAATIIDGSNAGSVVAFSHGEDASSILSGFTIQNGWVSPSGGGIICSSSSPSITNCTISGNTSSSQGGGIFITSSSPSITNCTISGNSSHYGAGIFCNSSSVNINNCTIKGNVADGNGGGINVSDSFLNINNCTIADNSVTYYGGGIFCSESSASITDCILSNNSATDEGHGGGICIWTSSLSITISNCLLTGNSASHYGGGIFCRSSSPSITNCTVSENSAAILGGGIMCSESSASIHSCAISSNLANYGGGIYGTGSSFLSIINCIITGNTAEYEGGGIDFNSSSASIANCTISDNLANQYGGGIESYSSSVSITNCISWNNSPNEIAGGTFTITYSDIKGGYPGEGNIDADPLFVNSNAGDYYLLPDSPCIDEGTDEGAPDTDIAGNPRPSGAGYDMGVYECDESFVRGDVDKDGDVDGTDLYLFAIAFDSIVVDPNYNKLADFDNDSDVDINDLNIFSVNFGVN